jgi:hypothetical protein
VWSLSSTLWTFTPPAIPMPTTTTIVMLSLLLLLQLSASHTLCSSAPTSAQNTREPPIPNLYTISTPISLFSY